MNQRIHIFLFLAISLIICTSCSPRQASPTEKINLPNPASVHCEQNGGKLEFRQDESGGTFGVCIFPDGSECEEWAYFRGECQPVEADGLNATRWKLLEMRGQNLLPDTSVTMMVNNGQISGSAGCNFYGSAYTTQSNQSFKINEIEMTAMDCPEPAGVMEQEQRYMKALTSVRAYEVDNSELLLKDEQRQTLLRFQLLPKFDVSPQNLIGKTWQLVSAPGLEGVEMSEFTLRFDGTHFSGTTACREYSGTYQTTNDRLKVVFLEMTTDVNCDEVRLVAEGNYTTLLGNIEQYNLQETKLELFTIQAEKLVFELVSE